MTGSAKTSKTVIFFEVRSVKVKRLKADFFKRLTAEQPLERSGSGKTSKTVIYLEVRSIIVT